MSGGDVCVTSVSVAFCSLQWGLPKTIRGSFSQVTGGGKSGAGMVAPEVLQWSSKLFLSLPQYWAHKTRAGPSAIVSLFKLGLDEGRTDMASKRPHPKACTCI